MLSKITIDVDDAGMPQILIVYKPSEDLRDRLIARFMHKMDPGGANPSGTGYAELRQVSSCIDGECTSVLTPILPYDADFYIKQLAANKAATVTNNRPVNDPISK